MVFQLFGLHQPGDFKDQIAALGKKTSLNHDGDDEADDMVVKRLASCFDSITYSHSYRESNHMADHLAKQGVHRISDFVAWL
ncbi:hypothetical protein NC652_019831 [Populus alba x Populus x berolinensis]|nr:hypothetical protein NC652_019831 [Populus alba x Populus x berolinensis]